MENGRNVGRSGASQTRVRFKHHQSAQKLHPEEQQITEEDKRESMEAERREKKLRSEDLTGMGREGSGRKTSRVRRGKIFRNF